jgi:tetratricopeptide (TPR) repeat protein
MLPYFFVRFALNQGHRHNMTAEAFDLFLRDLRQNIENPMYLNNNEEVIFDWLLEEGVKPHRIRQTVTILRRLIPHYLKQPSVKSWEQLIMRYLDVSLEGDVRDQLPEAHLVVGQYLLSSAAGRRAMQELAKAQKLAQENPNQQVLIDAYVEVLKADIFSPHKRLLKQEKTYDELLAYVDQTVNPETQAIIFYAVSMYHLRRNETDKSLDFATKAYQLEAQEFTRQQEAGWKAHDVRTRMIEALIAQAIIHRQRRELDESATKLRDAQLHCEDTIHSYQQAIIEHELGWIAYRQEKFEQAVKHMMKAKLTFESLKHEAFIAASNHSLGIMLIEQGDYKRSLTLLAGALKVYTAIPHHIHMLDVQHAIGYAYLHCATHKNLTAENLAKAERHLQLAKDIAIAHLENAPKRQQYHLDEIAKDVKKLEDLKRGFQGGNPSAPV